MNTEIAHALGVAFARFVDSDSILVGRDMRSSGVPLVESFTRGALEQGVDVTDIGLASTDLLYFAAGKLDRPGAMFTASHNPAEYNGVKLCLSGARPVGIDTGLATIRDAAADVLAGQGPGTGGSGRQARGARPALPVRRPRRIVRQADAIHPMRVVADTANGMGGLVVPAVFERFDKIELEVMYGELDGTFPNHPADPLQPANQRDLRGRVHVGRIRRRARLRR